MPSGFLSPPHFKNWSFNKWHKLLPILPVILFSSCISLLFPKVDTSQASLTMAGDPRLSNQEYASRIAADGWPIEDLNTAAHIDFLNEDEKNIILAHNLVRFDPEKFALLYVAEFIGYFRGNEFHYPGFGTIMLTREGVTPANELYLELLKTEPMGLLFPSRGLSQAAELHATYLRRRGIRGHGGQGGIRARIERFGRWDGQIGENISYGNFSAHDAVIFLMIDDDVFDRSHRYNVLHPGFNYIGVARDRHPGFPVGDMYVINYAHYFREHEVFTQP